VPAAIGLGTNLLGTADMIRERLRLYRAAGVTTLRAQLHGDPTTDLERQIDDLGRLLDLVADVNREPTNCEPIPHAAVDHHQVELPSHSSKGNNHD
jgi:hypothetical protein